jgi:hypothetical protein
MTSALEGARCQRHAPAALYPGKDAVPIVQEVGWIPGPVWTGAENLTPPEFDLRNVQTVAQSLYLLSYPAHKALVYIQLITRNFAVCNSARSVRVGLFLVSWCHRSLLCKCHILLTEKGPQPNKQIISFWLSHRNSLFIHTFGLALTLPRFFRMYISFRIYWIQKHFFFSDWSLARKI